MGVELGLTNTQARRTLRRMELEAYASVVSAFRAQGPLTAEKKSLLEDLCKLLVISQERHRAEVRRAVNEDLLSAIANSVYGADTEKAWRLEGQKLVASSSPKLVAHHAGHLSQAITAVLASSALAGSQPGSKDDVAMGAPTRLQEALRFVLGQNPAVARTSPDTTKRHSNKNPPDGEAVRSTEACAVKSVRGTATLSGAENDSGFSVEERHLEVGKDETHTTNMTVTIADSQPKAAHLARPSQPPIVEVQSESDKNHISPCLVATSQQPSVTVSETLAVPENLVNMTEDSSEDLRNQKGTGDERVTQNHLSQEDEQGTENKHNSRDQNDSKDQENSRGQGPHNKQGSDHQENQGDKENQGYQNDKGDQGYQGDMENQGYHGDKENQGYQGDKENQGCQRDKENLGYQGDMQGLEYHQDSRDQHSPEDNHVLLRGVMFEEQESECQKGQQEKQYVGQDTGVNAALLGEQGVTRFQYREVRQDQGVQVDMLQEGVYPYHSSPVPPRLNIMVRAELEKPSMEVYGPEAQLERKPTELTVPPLPPLMSRKRPPPESPPHRSPKRPVLSPTLPLPPPPPLLSITNADVPIPLASCFTPSSVSTTPLSPPPLQSIDPYEAIHPSRTLYITSPSDYDASKPLLLSVYPTHLPASSDICLPEEAVEHAKGGMIPQDDETIPMFEETLPVSDISLPGMVGKVVSVPSAAASLSGAVNGIAPVLDPSLSGITSEMVPVLDSSLSGAAGEVIPVPNPDLSGIAGEIIPVPVPDPAMAGEMVSVPETGLTLEESKAISELALDFGLDPALLNVSSFFELVRSSMGSGSLLQVATDGTDLHTAVAHDTNSEFSAASGNLGVDSESGPLLLKEEQLLDVGGAPEVSLEAGDPLEGIPPELAETIQAMAEQELHMLD